MPTVQVGTVSNGSPVEVYYEDVGSGAPVVLLHGWPLSGRAWERQVPALLDAGRRVITYDRRGFGWSSQVREGYDYDTLSDDLHAVIEHLDLRDVALVGFSMGGGEVVRYLGRHGSDRVAKAVLVAGVPPYMYATDGNPGGGVDDATIEQMQAGVSGDRMAFLDGFTRTFFSTPDREDLISEQARLYAYQIAAFASPKGTLDCIDAFSRTDFRDDVPKIDVPLLVLHGDGDQIVPFEISGRRMHQSVPGSRLVVVEGAPHGLLSTHPDEVNAALLDFLAS